MLQTEAVSKRYDDGAGSITALGEATLEISRGEFVAVVGPSGSGKSTLLQVLGGMLSPSSGRVLFEGQSVYDLSPNERARLRREKIGFVFQTFNLVPYLTALENVQVPLFLAGVEELAQEARAAELLRRVGLGDRLRHKPSKLSIGQQQRVALARVLGNDPDLILADEPTGNLDPETSEQIITSLEELNREGRTIVMVTHDPAAARRAGRVLRLVDGEIHRNGTVLPSPEEVEEQNAAPASAGGVRGS
jgi:putative ABC transport system ATP-binding protein